jgi:hypothetical protein
VTPPVVRTKVWPVDVTSVSFPVAVSRLSTMAIGMIQMIRKTVVSRSSCSG